MVSSSSATAAGQTGDRKSGPPPLARPLQCLMSGDPPTRASCEDTQDPARTAGRVAADALLADPARFDAENV